MIRARQTGRLPDDIVVHKLYRPPARWPQLRRYKAHARATYTYVRARGHIIIMSSSDVG